MILDLTLNAIQIPNLPTYVPPFGTKKTGISQGLTTQETNNNIIAAFVRQRPFTVAEISSTGIVQAHSCIVLAAGCTALTLGDASFIGCHVVLINQTAIFVQLITGTTSGYVLPYQTLDLLWNGTTWIVYDGKSFGEIDMLSYPISGTSYAPYGYLACDGSALSRTVFARLWAQYDKFTSVSFTCTTATPTVITVSSGHGFTGGERLRLSTTGTLTGATLTQDYFVEYISATTFYFDTTETGTTRLAITAQSGTHSYLRSFYGLGDGSTTFNLPDFRQVLPVGSGVGSTHSIATADTFGLGQFKDDQLLDHETIIRISTNTANQIGNSGNWIAGQNNDRTQFYGSTNCDNTVMGGFVKSNYRKGSVTRTKQIGVNYIVKY